MNIKETTKYFVLGFKFIKNHVWLILFPVIYYLLNTIKLIVPHLTLLHNFLELILFLLIFILISYDYSLPFIFQRLTENDKHLNLKEIASVIFKNLKRLIPLFALVAFFFFLIFIFLMGIAMIYFFPLYGENTKPFTDFASNLPWIKFNLPFTACVTILFFVTSGLLGYTSIFFSIEKKGILESMKQSVKFSISNLNWSFIIALVQTLVVSGIYLFPVNTIARSIVSLIVYCIGFELAASTFFYYKDHLQK